MTKKHYNKLIRAGRREFETEIMNESDYKQALRDKILEEGQEVVTDSDDEVVKEISDLYEVIDSLIVAYGLDKDAIIEM